MDALASWGTSPLRRPTSRGIRCTGCTSVVKITDVRERPHPTYMDVLVSWSTGCARTTPLKWGPLVLDGHGRLMTSCHRGIHTSLYVRWPSVAKGHGRPKATCASNGQNIIHTLGNNWTTTSALPSAGGRSAGCTSVVKNTDVRERPHPH